MIITIIRNFSFTTNMYVNYFAFSKMTLTEITNFLIIKNISKEKVL